MAYIFKKNAEEHIFSGTSPTIKKHKDSLKAIQ